MVENFEFEEWWKWSMSQLLILNQPMIGQICIVFKKIGYKRWN